MLLWLVSTDMEMRTPSIRGGCSGHLGPPEGALGWTWMLSTCVTLGLSLYLFVLVFSSVK